VADGCDAHGPAALGQLVNAAVGADLQRSEASQPALEFVAGEWLALEQRQRILNGVDQGPVEFEQLLARAAREDDARHDSAGRASLRKLGAQIRKRDGLPASEVGEARFNGGERRRVGQNLRGLLECLVLVDWYKRRSRLAIACYEHVVATISDVAEELA
jgi:hypothetical protein